MREIYTTSDETKEVFHGYVKQIAFELDKSDKYLYGILDDSKTDCFAVFRKLRKAAIRAGAPYHVWDDALEADAARYAPKKPIKTELECLKDKMNSHNHTVGKMVESLADGKLDVAEIRELLALLEIERATLDLLETRLTFQLGMAGEGECLNGHPN